MKPIYIIVLAAIGGLVAFIYFSADNGLSPETHSKEIAEDRAKRVRFMKESPESPFAGSEFKGLSFFEPTLKYRVRATLTPIENKKVIDLATSTGESAAYLEYSYADFELDGKSFRVKILETTEPGPQRGSLFLAFADETSGTSTYGAGRYLDLKKVPGATTLWLDFNKAYNPYCAYSDKFSCPFPPRENILKVPIQAGEKSYH